MIIKPIGARVFAVDLDPVDEVSERAKRSGLYAVVLDENKPRPTSARVVAVGNDPLIQESVQEGDIVFFAPHSGREIQVEGRTFRSLEIHEIISVMREESTAEQSPP